MAHCAGIYTDIEEERKKNCGNDQESRRVKGE